MWNGERYPGKAEYPGALAQPPGNVLAGKFLHCLQGGPWRPRWEHVGGDQQQWLGKFSVLDLPSQSAIVLFRIRPALERGTCIGEQRNGCCMSICIPAFRKGRNCLAQKWCQYFRASKQGFSVQLHYMPRCLVSLWSQGMEKAHALHTASGYGMHRLLLNVLETLAVDPNQQCERVCVSYIAMLLCSNLIKWWSSISSSIWHVNIQSPEST